MVTHVLGPASCGISGVGKKIFAHKLPLLYSMPSSSAWLKPAGLGSDQSGHPRSHTHAKTGLRCWARLGAPRATLLQIQCLSALADTSKCNLPQNRQMHRGGDNNSCLSILNNEAD